MSEARALPAELSYEEKIMNTFTYSYPVKVYFGEKAAEKNLAAELAEVGTNVMLAYGGGSIKKNGIYDELLGVLKDAGKTVTEFAGIMSNPTYAKVQEGAVLAKEKNIDFILAVGGGSVIRFLFFPLSSTTYTSTVLPPLFLVLILSYLEHWLEKHVPDFIKALAVPFLCAAIMVPLTIIVIGPLTSGVSNIIAAGYNALYAIAPALAGLIVGGLWEVIVVFGVHWGIVPIILANFENYGYDTIQIFITLAVISVMTACFAVAVKSRNKEMKGIALSSGITAFFGITEPGTWTAAAPV